VGSVDVGIRVRGPFANVTSRSMLPARIRPVPLAVTVVRSLTSAVMAQW